MNIDTLFKSNRPIAWYKERWVNTDEFLSEVAALAARLPQHQYVFNLCQDRYLFLVGLVAALQRKQVTLLPPNRVPRTLTQLAAAYPDYYCFTDHMDVPAGLNIFQFDASFPIDKTADEFLPIAPGQVAIVSFTSGSTGVPQPHLKTWGNLVASILAQGKRLPLPLEQAATLVGTVPQQHMFGLESTVLTPWLLGHILVSERPFFSADIRALLTKLPAPRVLITTPLHIRALVTEQIDLPELSFILSATAPLSQRLAQEAEQLFGAPVYEIYGCTETGTLATRRTIDGEIWRLHEGVSLSNAHGRVFAQGGHVEHPIALNDMVQIKNAREFVLQGRLSELVNIAGKRTTLTDLNLALNEIAGVQDGVFFVPEDAGEEVTRLTAFVVAPHLTPTQILKALREKIDEVFLPRPLHIVEVLPRNETGKLPRKALYELQTAMNQ